MASKRSRSAFEADLQARESPFVAYGTPLPPLDSETRDDGSYVPVWKQEVTDDRGRKRLHGAFTGGFSAGYFNTVGSKEGWTPSTFISSRSKKWKDEEQPRRPEDFMDEEDLADHAEDQRLMTNEEFAGFGTAPKDGGRKGKVMDLFRSEGETIGGKLLKRMGWREGQGIGPRIQRTARLESGAYDDAGEEHMFAPDDTQIPSFSKKHDRKGIGLWEGEQRGNKEFQNEMEEREQEGMERYSTDTTSIKQGSKAMVNPRRGGLGTGVLNDTGSDDEDPYELGPRVSYNRAIGGDKKKSKVKSKVPKPAKASNPLLESKPLYKSSRLAESGVRKCNDGRLPLHGFLLAAPMSTMTIADDAERYPTPEVPAGWSSSKLGTSSEDQQHFYQSTADAAKSSKLDPKARSTLLGEAALPGKSVFDYLSPAARSRIVTASGRNDLPAAGSEAMPSIKTEEDVHDELPQLDKPTASVALGRGVGGWMPYVEEPPKRERYRNFLEFHAGLREQLPTRPPEFKRQAWLQELREFAHAARVFRPVTGVMASRFQSSSTGGISSTQDTADTGLSDGSAENKPQDPAVEAAQMGLFGPLTRRVLTFYPSRLVCKRFGVKPPAHVTSDNEGRAAHGAEEAEIGKQSRTAPGELGAQSSGSMLNMKNFARGGIEHGGDAKRVEGGMEPTAALAPADEQGVTMPEPEEDPSADRNEALEATRAGEELFKAVFGDGDSD